MAKYCMFCENEAEYQFPESKAPICWACKEVYEAGQANPNETIEDMPKEEED